MKRGFRVNDELNRPTNGEGTGTGARMKAAVADKPAEAKEKISEFGRKAADQIDSQRGPVATTLDKTASAIHEQGENAASIAHATAHKLGRTADYVGEHGLRAMANDIQDLAKRYPGVCLASAVAIGFAFGRACFRRAD